MRRRGVHVAAPSALLSLIASAVVLVLAQVPAQAVEGSWEPTGSLNVPRLNPTSTLLEGGKVLVAGGRNFTFTASLDSAELYDPISETFTLTGSMHTPRWSHVAVLLPNGKVLVAGGFTSPTTNLNAQPVTDTAELYDPATGTWTPTGSMNVRRALHVMELLPDGRVLAAGGRTCNAPPPTACNFMFTTNTAELYDPATGTWTPTGSMTNDRHTTWSALLPDGRVLVPAGFPGGQNTADLYDPATGTWRLTGTMRVVRARQGAMLLPDGRVLVAAGSTGTATLTSETYNPATDQWTLQGNVAQNRFNYFFAELPNGKVLIAGGAGGPTAMTTAEVFDPATNTWTSAGTLPRPHGTSSSLGNSVPAVVLSANPRTFVFDPRVCGDNCGKVLLVGDNPSGAAELYTPAPVALTTCTNTITGDVGDVTVPAGSVTCVTNARVAGSIVVQPGGALVLTNSRVAGGVRAQGASGVRICGSQIRAPAPNQPALSIVGTFGPVVVGDGLDDGPPGCARNDFSGAVLLDANQSVEFSGNRVSGNVTVTNTAGPAVLEANQITGALACANNTPVPTNDGRPNAVLGPRSGQCSAPGF